MEYILIAARKLADFFGISGVSDVTEMEVEIKNGSFGSLVEAEAEVKEEIAVVKEVIASANDEDDVWERIEEEMANGMKVRAIKMYREMTGCDLRKPGMSLIS